MKKNILRSLIVVLVLALTCIYTLPGILDMSGSESSVDNNNVNASFNFDQEALLEQLKAKNVESLNKDLVKKVDDYKLTGEVKVIITLSEGSIVEQYNADNKGRQLKEFLESSEAKTTAERAISRQERLEAQLLKEGLISSAKYHYSSILDGFSATTTYENLSKLVNHDGVYRVIISNTYLPMASNAVENKVNVYDTGIFNSTNSGNYTGKGTIVAILDTGCDYRHPAFTTHEVERPLYDSSDIAQMLPNTVAARSSLTPLEARDVYYGNITKNKIAFGYDYADNDPDVMPLAESHGTHVAGIIGGYADDPIFQDNDKFDGNPETTLRGVAIDTQFAIMKVFGDYETGADDDNILAALEDCVNLHVDAINMSLGTSCGFTREADDVYKSNIYDSIENAGISLVVAASNDYSSGMGGDESNTNKVTNPDSGTVGAPATYESALAVASINGNKDKYMTTDEGKVVFFDEAGNSGSESYDFFKALNIQPGENKTYEYVTIPGDGSPTNYLGLEVQGKIVLVQRGGTSFEEKAMTAQARGAAGIIIYNNVYGVIIMSVGDNIRDDFGVASIDKEAGDALAAKASGTLTFNGDNQAGPFMSDFSSWGPNPDLTLKPEITAHGGNIWSSVPGGGYEKLSGTSMASPNMCGIAVLVRQYVKDNFAIFDPAASDAEHANPVLVRNAVNQLVMSTAIIALNEEGNPYAPRKQGAGIADIIKATTTKAYIYTKKDGVEMTTTKLELGDDPERKGVYEMTFFLRNISDKSVSYKLGDLSMTESVTTDNKFVAEMSYMLETQHVYSVKEGTGSLNGDVVTVKAGETAEVTVKLTLNDSDKEYINTHFVNGMYVEGFITLTSQDEGVDLNVPYLAFFGDWSEAPIFDIDYYAVETTAHNNALDDEDKIKADYFATMPMALYYYDYLIPMGSFLYDQNPDYDPIPATQEHAALSYFPTSLSGIYSVYTGLLRGAKEMLIEVRNTATGEVVWSQTQYNCYKAHYNGQPMPYISDVELSMITTDEEEGHIADVFGDNNAHFEVTMTAKLDWEGERNISDTYTFGFYIDYQAPTILGSRFYTELNSDDELEYYVELEVYDNHYAMSVCPVVLDYQRDENGNIETNAQGQQMMALEDLANDVTPVLQEERGSSSIVRIRITDYLDRIKNSLEPDYLMFRLDDYALNMGLAAIPFPEIDNANLDFDLGKNENGTAIRELTIRPGETRTVSDLVQSTTSTPVDEDTRNFLFLLNWNSSNTNVATIHQGVLEGISEGTSTVSFVSGGRRKSITVRVAGEPLKDPNNRDNVYLKEVILTKYRTNFAFNSDIDRSEIGSSGDENYFEGSPYVSMYPSERITIDYQINPWNLAQNSDRYTLRWRTNNPGVARVDQYGMVTAISEGSCAITLSITVDGVTQSIEGRCDVNVKSPFVIEGSELVAYKGMGDNYNGEDRGAIQSSGQDVVVTIPANKGILSIGSYAFCHYNLDNSRVVDDKYDFDAKKDPLGNNTVTKVIIPDGVTTISKYAFYNSLHLKEVVLPDTLTNVGENAFEKCGELVKINLDDVDLVSRFGFKDCVKLSDVGANKLANIFALGESAFENCAALQELNLANLRIGGTACFKGTTKLATVTLGQNTRLSASVFENSGISSTVQRPLVVHSDTVPIRAFYNCDNLVAVVFEHDVTYVGDQALGDCAKLESVTFNGTAEAFGTDVFDGSDAITKFTVDKKYYLDSDGIMYDSEAKTKLLFATPLFKGTTVHIPASVVEIGEGAFAGLTTLTDVIFDGESSLRIIGNDAFFACTALANITLPNSIESIGTYAFARTAIPNLDLSGSKLTTISEGAFGQITALQSVSLPASLTSIGGQAFRQTSIRELDISATKVESIGEAAFFRCVGLTNVNLPETCTVIEDNAFEHCLALTTVNLEHVKEVGSLAFYVTALEEANLIADGVRIGDAAFAGDLDANISPTALKKVALGDNAVVYGQYAFLMAAITDKDFALGENVQITGDFAFAYCYGLLDLDITGVTGRLGDYAFSGCVYLKSVNMPDVTEIGEATFYYCPRLDTVKSPNLKKVGNAAFYPRITTTQSGGQQITSVPLKNIDLEKVEEIGYSAFANTGLTGVLDLPALKHIGANAFDSSSIQGIKLSDNFVSAEPAAMSGATNFNGFQVGEDRNYQGTNFVLDDGVLYVKVPNGGLNLVSYPVKRTEKEYTVLEGTVRIENSAFENNARLSTVTLPGTLKTIGDYAFYKCNRLSKVVFNSYYAPVLEGSLTAGDEITSDNQQSYPNLDDLYKYDFHWQIEGVITLPEIMNLLSYSNFVDLVTKHAKIDMEIPAESEGYDTALYRTYFKTPIKSETTKVGRYATDFIDAVNALPENVDRFSADKIQAARDAYLRLEANGQQSQVDEAVLERYNNAVFAYEVDVARNAFNKLELLDVDRSRNSYERIQAAYNALSVLTDEEKEAVAEALGYDADEAFQTKLQALKVKLDWNDDIDFTRDYDVYGGYIRVVIDSLKEVAGDLTTETLGDQDYDQIKRTYDLLYRDLSSDDRDKAGNLLDKYIALVTYWNNVAGTSPADAVSTAKTIADSTLNGLFAAVTAINALLATAYVVLKGGIL